MDVLYALDLVGLGFDVTGGLEIVADAIRSALAERDAQWKEAAARVETAARALLRTYMRPTDPMWCGCCASKLEEAGGPHKPDCEAAALLRALLDAAARSANKAVIAADPE